MHQTATKSSQTETKTPSKVSGGAKLSAKQFPVQPKHKIDISEITQRPAIQQLPAVSASNRNREDQIGSVRTKLLSSFPTQHLSPQNKSYHVQRRNRKKRELDDWVKRAISYNKSYGHRSTPGLLNDLYEISKNWISYKMALESGEIDEAFVFLVRSAQQELLPNRRGNMMECLAPRHNLLR